MARGLLGTWLLSTVGGERVRGIIVETEAYGGAEDPASHAAVRAGRTERNRAMFGPAGRLYVYRSYGIHWCANVVTGPEGTGQAVLLRGVDVREGGETALRRRGRHPLAAGPGRLAQAFGIDDGLYGHLLQDPPLELRPGRWIHDDRVGVGGRIGVTRGAERPLRFYVRGAAGLSRPD